MFKELESVSQLYPRFEWFQLYREGHVSMLSMLSPPINIVFYEKPYIRIVYLYEHSLAHKVQLSEPEPNH